MAFRKKEKKAHETFHDTFHFEGGGTMGFGLSEGMRSLCDHLTHSFDARVARVKALRHETAAKLREFRQEMKNVQHKLRGSASEVRRFLSNAETSRMRDFRTMHQGIMARQEERNREVTSMLGGFRRMMTGFRQDHETAASHWHNFAAAMAKKRASLAR